MMTLERKTVSIPRACELVGVSRRTIYNWLAGGKVEYVRTAGGSVRIFADTLWREPHVAATGAPRRHPLSSGTIVCARAAEAGDGDATSVFRGHRPRVGPRAAVP